MPCGSVSIDHVHNLILLWARVSQQEVENILQVQQVCKTTRPRRFKGRITNMSMGWVDVLHTGMRYIVVRRQALIGPFKPSNNGNVRLRMKLMWGLQQSREDSNSTVISFTAMEEYMLGIARLSSFSLPKPHTDFYWPEWTTVLFRSAPSQPPVPFPFAPLVAARWRHGFVAGEQEPPSLGSRPRQVLDRS